MKSTWHIISVEVESLYLPQFPTLSKYLKIYGYYINGQSSQMKKKTAWNSLDNILSAVNDQPYSSSMATGISF
jgi:hypothetical protein